EWRLRREDAMIVMKFGGTSVGIPANFRVALALVAEREPRDPVVVVSALSGVTNLLVELCREPARREEIAARVVDRHLAFARELELPAAELTRQLDAFRGDVERHGRAHQPVHGAEHDLLLSWGERLSALLFAAGLSAAAVPARAVLAGDAGLVTDERFGGAHPLPESEALLREALEPR